jgi:hypothetical protein
MLDYIHDHNFWSLSMDLTKVLVQILILLYLMKINRSLQEKG